MVDIKIALKLAILANPEAFGLNPGDLNPLHVLAYRQATGEDAEYEGEDEDTQVLECCASCEAILAAKVSELLKGIPPVKGKGKPRQGSKSGKAPAGKKGPMVSAKQLKYIGFLLHELGETPDYKAIKKLTQQEASARIAELEKRKKQENGE